MVKSEFFRNKIKQNPKRETKKKSKRTSDIRNKKESELQSKQTGNAYKTLLSPQDYNKKKKNWIHILVEHYPLSLVETSKSR